MALAPGGGRVAGVTMEDGATLGGAVVVNAAGPWFNQLNKTAGVELSTKAVATRIQVGHKWIPDEFCSLPFVADGWGPSGNPHANPNPNPNANANPNPNPNPDPNPGIYFMPRAANNQLVFGSVAHRFESETLDDPDACNASLDPDVKQDYPYP